MKSDQDLSRVDRFYCVVELHLTLGAHLYRQRSGKVFSRRGTERGALARLVLIAAGIVLAPDATAKLRPSVISEGGPSILQSFLRSQFPCFVSVTTACFKIQEVEADGVSWHDVKIVNNRYVTLLSATLACPRFCFRCSCGSGMCICKLLALF